MTAERPETDIRPKVALARSGAPPWLLAGCALLAAGALFLILDGQRRERTAPATRPGAADRVLTIAPLPPLVVPPEPPPPPARPVLVTPTVVATPTPPISAPPPPVFSPPPAYAPPPTYTPPPVYTPPAQPTAPPSPVSSTGASVLVIDTARSTRASERSGPASPNEAGPAAATDLPVRSESLRRPASTVARGVLIPAILETALDSTRPGMARAIVSSDIASFDGSRILIPRGSRLIGEYAADLTAGQTRAMVRWTRLVRPDGETIALDSQAADLTGRAGVTGRVDNRFLQRFSRAILQTTLNIGASLAAREIGGDGAGVIIALPGSSQTTAAAATSDTLQPIVRVDAGARIAVLVAQDLEFASGTPRR
ncbi:hypothetical protein GCM10009422_18160 [Brevundimonas kwangchunensis]|uniref:TrbI/VirB10 family protein n=1 Tax=Brevundimonas kwangchunensis TaxID=322163 RepID=A0ABN1GXE5_9CAUL